eukprot:TRINITY_DN3141_c0_g2_i5.p1 TRINITY_DN3141_c0_g2~~TRINITY_DN3141_c0_g2_i5.p1  ORF type:complete len:185 (-),score=26.46 TRINITY_DN3141_c0_g2_i5:55-609(-)
MCIRDRYDSHSKRWIEIASMVNKATGLSLASFNDQFIYKFGGRIDALSKDCDIEKYDLMSNKWTVVNLIQSQQLIKMPNFSAAIQISHTDILIFGGLLNDQTLDDCYIFKAQNRQMGQQTVSQGEIVLHHCKLPSSGTFLNSPLLFGKNILAIMNTNYDKLSYSNFQAKKIPIVFDNSQWKQLQ